MNTQPAMHPAPRPHRHQPPGGLAITSLVLGIVGVVLSYMPIINNLSAAGAAVGFVLGFIGIWKSKPVMSGFGVFLCGTAVILTVAAQIQLGRELDDIKDRFDQDMTNIEQQIDQDMREFEDCWDSYGDDTGAAMLNCGNQ